MLNLLSLVFNKKERNLEGYLKAHLNCYGHKQEINVEYTCMKQVLHVRCYYCFEEIKYYPSGEVINNSNHDIKPFSRSETNFKPKSSL